MNKVIELKDINKFYKLGKGKLHALKSINLVIEEGDFLMITGKSGSGKTTLMNVLAFLDTFNKGEYLFKEKNVTHMIEDERCEFRNKYIGFIFQQFHLIQSLTVGQNVELPLLYGGGLNKSERRERVITHLKEVGLEDKVNQKPFELSGGQQQRVAIARALVNSPSIIFADEPTGALDSETGTDIMNLLKKLNKDGKTIVMVTHDLDLKFYANKVIVISDGKVVKEGE
ncbi:ABC transporter ATP-binding protein [Hathewaya histolytica]|uniref:ABC transporter n=1 Tax=Hathewaya histolytica TaxID=1498 RepID=A0A4U9R3G2_HATHI|nr:ABC transporter ATP-binding protein [Hathewaya histolytica]VTQ85576.1 ABC transporter [Hathewaya histolytica]